MLRIDGKNIELTRGDTTRFTIRLLERDMAEETPSVFTVKKAAWQHAEGLIRKEIPVTDNAVHVFLTSEETNLPAGEYAWDVRVLENDESGTVVLTPMEHGIFRVLEAIGDV